MQNEGVNFLDAGGVVGGDDDFVIAAAFGLSAVFAGDEDGDDIEFFGRLECADDIGAIAAGGEADEDIARFGESFYATGENMFVAVVVADAGDGGGVSVETNGG